MKSGSGDPRKLDSRTRGLLVALQAFVGVGALFGGYGLLVDAEGLGLEREWLEGSPFADYRIPGLFLLIVIGGGMLVSAVLALIRSRYAVVAAFAMGLTLALWLIIETLIIGFQDWSQYALLLALGTIATVLMVIGARAIKRSRHDFKAART
jgi:hypothetical protein